MSPSPRLFPLVSADVALFSVEQDALQVLLVQRAEEPEQHRWALPGAVLKPDRDQDLEVTARRALRDKISVDVPYLEQVRTFSGKDRDPRGWSIGVLFYALLPQHLVNAVVKRKVEAVKWAPVSKIGTKLAFDHGAQLATALQLLRDKVARHALPLHLLSENFTLTELQRSCELILGEPMDKSVFRRRLKGSADLVEVEGKFALGPQRPAQLYKARDGFEFSAQ